MDEIYSVYDGIASEKINIGKYFEKYHEAIREEWYTPAHANGEQSIASFMPSSLGEEELEMLAEYCSIDKLTVPGELERYKKQKGTIPKFESSEIPKGTNLKTLAYLEEQYKLQSHSSWKAAIKYAGEITIEYEKVDSKGPFAVPGKDTIIFIRVYEPCRAVSSTGKRIILSRVIAVLGFQTLEKVRDLIECNSDLSILKDISDNPDAPHEPNAKDIYKSNFIYIEGTFYNDLRDPTSEDNSAVIREWAQSRNLGPFKTARMNECRIDTLSVRFGYPWVYQHQGNCEHFIVFSDARFLTTEDELAVSAYPRIHRTKQRRTRYCMMCSVSPVQWIVTDSDRIPHNPACLCDVCFKSYNYVNGKKVGKFKAYRYPDHAELLADDRTEMENKKAFKSQGRKKGSSTSAT
ncbi:snRNA-activating protein complex subunit 3 [Venturia canescens]|uniref:snRNA-activating protein complex subunit 3 n=1 Tax=Venturia canescens TaxID=32260 RepID=UPI001C9C560D|nr:snRNA-activating protein complex subunit 3 [Venturia canescens]XP_043271675.1 snRNA-activating protein complex subunit 3 [Venturia canescens]XP_043271676.1 snRNA-activating protein complex subunit 3 [Venturia canescens]